ncbi:hypothetical protein [Xanthobacter autotrophicus]|uniref:hypothetical protein n=1 Tax=Xanthobacter autotrophicus TaxID=280 RepID=UPI003728AAD8
MAEDIVARLRDGLCVTNGAVGGWQIDYHETLALMGRAADEIERLKAVAEEQERALALAGKRLSALDRTNARLSDGLIRVIDCDRHNFYDGPPPRYVEVARAALNPKDPAHDRARQD